MINVLEIFRDYIGVDDARGGHNVPDIILPRCVSCCSSLRDVQELAWVIREYGEDGDPLMADRIAEMVMAYVEKRQPLIHWWHLVAKRIL